MTAFKLTAASLNFKNLPKKGSEIVASAELEQRLQSSVNTVAETVISADYDNNQNSKKSLKKPSKKKCTFDAKKILQKCPASFQKDPTFTDLSNILTILNDSPTGLYQHEIAQQANLQRSLCIKYLNMLLKADEITRESKKGFLYKIRTGRHYN
ncbi:uncharacterized protein LOC135144212 [Zophobas morio]|uniref:uncharacterized protein LOC135144212 n=1 Tax=Zophobas morio TaxID=2755281 RepID=UPI003083C923